MSSWRHDGMSAFLYGLEGYMVKFINNFLLLSRDVWLVCH